MRRWEGQGGFTLIELVFVMVILGVLLATSFPRFTETSTRLRAEQSAFELTQLLRYARERAVAGSQEVVWVWDEEERRAWLAVVESQPTGETEEVRLGERLTVTTPVPEGIEVTPVRDGSSVDRVRFFPDGTSEPVQIEIQRDGTHYLINVDAVTSQAELRAGSVAR